MRVDADAGVGTSAARVVVDVREAEKKNLLVLKTTPSAVRRQCSVA